MESTVTAFHFMVVTPTQNCLFIQILVGSKQTPPPFRLLIIYHKQKRPGDNKINVLLYDMLHIAGVNTKIPAYLPFV